MDMHYLNLMQFEDTKHFQGDRRARESFWLADTSIPLVATVDPISTEAVPMGTWLSTTYPK
jgi:hypothetical protein